MDWFMGTWILPCVFAGVFLLVWHFFRSRTVAKLPGGLAVFVSGCDSGIGQHLAVHFSELGCYVFAGCLDPNTARTVLPDKVCVLQLDLTREDSVREAVDRVRSDLKERQQDLWSLVNNAGVCVYGQFEWQTWKQCEQQVQVNLLGTMRLTRAFIPLLRRSKGRIITVTSINGFLAYPGLSVYCATKFALEGFCDALRLELGSGVRVITVRPGDYARATGIMSRHQQNARDMWDAMPEEERQRCGDFFHRYHQVTLRNFGLTSPDTLDGSTVLRDVQEAVLSESPATKYVSAPVIHRLVYGILTLLPTTCLDYLFAKVTENLYRAECKTENETNGRKVGKKCAKGGPF